MNEVMTTESDEQLIQRARAGSVDALGALYRQHAESVFWAAYRVTGSVQEAEDVLQDVFVGLRDALQRFDTARPLEPWLRRVAIRTALNRLRAEGRRRGREAHATPESPEPATGAPSVLWRIRLRRALEELPDTLRAVLLLKEVEGYSHREIGELLGISSAASAARLSRAIKTLRKQLRGTE